MPSLAEVLTEKQHCTQADVDQAQAVRREYGGRLGSILLNMGVISEKQMLDGLGEVLGAPLYAHLKGRPRYLRLPGIAPRFLMEQDVMPMFLEERDGDEPPTSGPILLAVNDPFQLETFTLVENLTGRPTSLVLATEEELRELAAQVSDEELERVDEGDAALDEEVERLREIASEAPVIKLVNAVFSKAVELRASDIHFESHRHSMTVRVRVDGVLQQIDTVPNRLKLAVIARLKLLSQMNIAENRLPQDGRITIRVAGKGIDIRASSAPTSFGESFVLRLLGKEDIRYSLDSLGFLPDQLEILRRITGRPNGIFLTTGPTGSGKTTTLYSVLNEIKNDTNKVITVEDPVEYELEGISQIQVRPDIGYTFAGALRSILRQDPDIVMVGEIRDPETAEIAIQASLTGHLVLSTLHTNSALSSITRLLDMGMEHFLLDASIIGMMAQRLVRTLCPHCSRRVDLDPAVARAHGIDELGTYCDLPEPTPREPVGCEHCGGTGYRGRMVVAEILTYDKDVQDRFAADRTFDDMNALGLRTMRQDGLIKYLMGRVDLGEILRVT